jgi:integrase
VFSKPDDQKRNPDPAENTRPKVIEEVLGHASVAFTMGMYSHVMDGIQEDTIALLDNYCSLFR